MAAATANSKTRMTALLKGMEKKYGVTKLIGTGASLEQCMFLILREGWDFKKASRAIRTLEAGFIDWNEVRVSSVAELDAALSFLKCADMPARLGRLRDFLEALMNEFNDLGGDMFDEMEFEPLRRLLINIDGLGRANAYMFLQLYMSEMAKQPKSEVDKDKVLVVAPESMRVAIRLGILKKTQSANLARKEFMKLLGPRDYVRFQNLFVRHAESVCLSKNPQCTECFLSGSCDFFKSR